MAEIKGALTNLRGPAARITSVTAEAVPADQAPSVVMSGLDQNRHLHFRLARGLPGFNAVPTDEAFATLVGATDTETYTAVSGRLDAYRRGLPPYVTAAGGRPSHSIEYDPYLRLFYESSNDMWRILDALSSARAGLAPANILFIGDSKTAGSAVSYAGSVPNRFLTLTGALDGIGFGAHAVSSAPDTRWSGIVGFTATGTSMHLNAASGINSAKFTGIRRSTGLRLIWGQSGSLAAHSVSFDGATGGPLSPTGTIIPPGATSGFYYQDFTGTEKAHSLLLTIDATDVSFQLLGVQSLHATPQVTVTNAGLHGSYISGWTPENTSRLAVFNATAGVVSQLPGARIAIVQLGTNISPDMPAGMAGIVAALKSRGFFVMLVVPGGTTTAPGDRVDLKRALYDIAADQSLPLVDFTDLIGNTLANARGYMADQLHENARGYMYEASLLRRVLATS